MQDTTQPLSGKTALVTGAAKRVGAVIAQRLHALGANLVLHYRSSQAGADALCKEFNQAREGSAITVQADLLDPEVTPALIEAALDGWDRLDILVNNASTFYATPVGQITVEQFDDMVGTNLRAPLFLSQTAAPALLEQSGCIINIIDIHAERPMKGFPVYSAAKAGLSSLTKSLAKELAPKVRVNGVAPGAILWPQGMGETTKADILQRIPLQSPGSPEDIAAAVAFLAQAGYITGHILTVDGGRTLHM